MEAVVCKILFIAAPYASPVRIIKLREMSVQNKKKTKESF